MSESQDFKRRRNEFFALSDFAKFVYPILGERRDDLVASLIDKGGDEPRFRIKEIDRLVEIFENVGTNESATKS